MAFDLHIVQSETRSVTVEYGGQELEAIYRPGVISTEFAAGMKKAEVDQDVEAMAKGASEMLSDWDMVNEGQKLDPDLAILRKLPLDLLGAIFAACMEDATAGEDTKND